MDSLASTTAARPCMEPPPRMPSPETSGGLARLRLHASALSVLLALLFITSAPASAVKHAILTSTEIEFLCGFPGEELTEQAEDWPLEKIASIDDSEQTSWLRAAGHVLAWRSPEGRDPYRTCLYQFYFMNMESGFTWSRRFGALELVNLEENPKPDPRAVTYADLQIVRSDFPSLKIVEEFYDLNNLRGDLGLDWSWTIEQADQRLQEQGIKPIQAQFGSGWLIGQDAYLPQWESPCTKGGPWECQLSDTLRATIYRIPRDPSRKLDRREVISKVEDDPIYILAYESVSRELKALWEYTALPSMRLWKPPGTVAHEVSSATLRSIVPEIAGWRTRSRNLDSAIVPTDWFNGNGHRYIYWKRRFETEGRNGAISKFWTNAEGLEYRILDQGPSSYAITESVTNGDLQRIFHFTGINGTSEYHPPSVPTVRILHHPRIRWFTSTPIQISSTTQGLIETKFLTGNFEPVQETSASLPEDGKVVTSDKWLLRVSAHVENEAGRASDSLLLPAVLPLAGTLLAVALSLATALQRSESSYASWRRKRARDFAHEIEHAEILLEQGLLDDAEVHVDGMARKHPRRKAETTALRRKLEFARLQRQRAVHAAESSIPAHLKARIDLKSGRLDLNHLESKGREDQ